MNEQQTNTKRNTFLRLFWCSLAIHILLPLLVFGFDFSSFDLKLILSSYLSPLWIIICSWLLLSILIGIRSDVPLLSRLKSNLKEHTFIPKFIFILIFVGSWYLLPGVHNLINTFVLNLSIDFPEQFNSLHNFISTELPQIVSILFWEVIVFLLLSILIYAIDKGSFNIIVKLDSIFSKKSPFSEKVWSIITLPFYDLGTRGKAIVSILAAFFVIFAFVLSSPHFPGSGTVYFAGVAAVVGLIFTWSASAAIADFIAGIILIFFADLEEGDWVKIGDITGKIQEQNLLIHQIKTTKNTIVTIPNGDVLKNIITNYTPSKNTNRIDSPQIIHTTVTLGYDVDQGDAIDALESAAKSTSEIITQEKAEDMKENCKELDNKIFTNLKEFYDEVAHPERSEKSFEPFVLITSLDDFYVSYELNAYLNPSVSLIDPGRIPKIYSELHQNIQQECLKGEIEILSPHYNAERDGNNPAVPVHSVDRFRQAQNKLKGKINQVENN